jgi:hypothetical protein
MTGYESKKAAAQDKLKCQCSMTTSLVGSGCQYCNPEYMDDDAQPAQEPVAWRTFDGEGGYDYRAYDMNEHYAEEWNNRNPNHKGWVEALYTTPPQRPWVGLTDEIIENIFQSAADADEETHIRFARAIEQHLKSKNT